MLYHYTIAARIRAILDSGMLVPHREAGCGPGTPALAVALPDPHWEGGSAPYARGRLLSFHEMLR